MSFLQTSVESPTAKNALSSPPISKINSSARPPPPSLFQGPTRAASHIELVLPDERNTKSNIQGRKDQPRASRVPAASSFSGPSIPKPHVRNDDFRAEAAWAEMQRTLADVELSATSSSHVFGESHAKALEDLRLAQLALAQAWAKSEADEVGDHDFDIAAARANVGELKSGSGSNAKEKSKNSTFSNEKDLEAETEKDIELARKRREANDRFFEQVNRGVLDVVSKLDEVANVMRKVEKESRDVWNDSAEEEGSVPPSATATDRSFLTDSPVQSSK